MLPIPPVLLKMIGLALVAVGLFGYGYYKGKESGQKELDLFRAQVVATARAQADVAAHVAKQQKETNDEINKGYQSELAATHAYYRGLLAHAARSRAMPALPTTTGSTDATSSDTVPPAAVSIPLDGLHLAEDCALTTVQLVNLQEWVRRQGDIGS